MFTSSRKPSRLFLGPKGFWLVAALPVLAATALLVLYKTPAHADCSLEAANGVDWQDCRKRNLDMREAKLSGSDLERADFTSTDLRHARLDKAKLHKAVLVRVNLSQASARESDFTKVLGYKTVFSNADFTGSNFRFAEIARSDFSGANLQDASFANADLARGNFTNAILTGSSFSAANLARADLRGMKFDSGLDFTGAFLMRTNIEGLDLSKAKGLAQWQIDMACGDETTVLETGLTKPANWPCKTDGEE